MDASKGVIAVDWGTTNRRAFLISEDGRVRAELRDAQGVLAVAPVDFAAQIADLQARFGNLPLILAGMIGSDRGWVQVPYVPCPASLDRLAEQVARPEQGIIIVPGVVDLNGRDVMRGEEVQLLGAIEAGLVPPDAHACHPGTHAKWAVLAGGSIVRFRTAMTGELFALLRAHSILAPVLRAPVDDGEAFRLGVRRSLDGPALLSDLFGVRARTLLGDLPEADAACYASGLLIGADVASGLEFVGPGPVALLGDGRLTRLYAAALACAGRAHTLVEGEEAFAAGAAAIARRL